MATNKRVKDMQLNDEEKAMLNGEQGEPRRWAMDHMIRVGWFFDAPDFVPVSQVHMMADTESLGEAGVAFVEGLAAHPKDQRRVRVPMITDPRGIDFNHYRRLKQTDAMAGLEQRAIDTFEALGILMTDTCINYQTIMPPVRGEHLAYGDTGVVIYCNSVLGACSNFEGGPSALAAGLTGRVPRYGLHLDENRNATKRYVVKHHTKTLSDWGALGGIIGKRAGSYWEVPVIEGIDWAPNSDELKHKGAAMASFGSIPLFHLVGVTPEAPTVEAVCDPKALAAEEIVEADFQDFFGNYAGRGGKGRCRRVLGAPAVHRRDERSRRLNGRQENPQKNCAACRHLTRGRRRCGTLRNLAKDRGGRGFSLAGDVLLSKLRARDG